MAQLPSITEIALRLPFLNVNRSPIQYVFCARGKSYLFVQCEQSLKHIPCLFMKILWECCMHRAVFTWLSKGIGFGFGFGFTTPFGWLVYLLWFWFYDSQVKTALITTYSAVQKFHYLGWATYTMSTWIYNRRQNELRHLALNWAFFMFYWLQKR